VNTVAPGPIATELFRAVNPDGEARTRHLTEGVPAGRIGAPADVANAVVFFLNPRSGFVTGQTRYVCGGSVRRPRASVTHRFRPRQQ
jgi:3-oxoacyl-[acyl-carrier protein] reductase